MISFKENVKFLEWICSSFAYSSFSLFQFRFFLSLSMNLQSVYLHSKNIPTHKHIDRQKDRQIERIINGTMERQADGQTGRLTEMQMDRYVDG
jgi:hypothetical protein